MRQDDSVEPVVQEEKDGAVGLSGDARRVDLGAAVLVVNTGWRRGAVIAVATFAVVAVFGYLKPDVYTAKASFLPPSGGSNIGAFASELSLLTGANGLLPQKSSGDTYVEILESRTLADKLIARFHLLEYYKVRKQSVAEAILAANSKFEVSVRGGVITIKVTDRNPVLARDLANAYLAELHEENGDLAITEAAQRRLFFEQQLEKEKNKLADAEVALGEVKERTGAIAPAGETQVAVQTRALLASRQAELAGLRASATEENSDVIRLNREIADLRRQLGSVQGSGAGTTVSQAEVEYVRRERDVKYHEGLFEVLSKQYESARLDESHDAPVLQVLDYAVVPDTRSGPARTLMLGVGFLLGILLGITYTLVRDRRWMQIG